MSTKLKFFLIIETILSFLFIALLYFLYPQSQFNITFLYFTLLLFLSHNISLIFSSDKENEIMISINLPIILPSLIILNPFLVAIMVSIGTITTIKSHSWYKKLFNCLMFATAAGGAALVFQYSSQHYENIISLLFAAFTYSTINHLYMFFLLRFTQNQGGNYLKEFIPQIIKDVFISYFLGLGFYYIYQNFGKFLLISAIILIFILKDIYSSELRNKKINEKLEKTEAELAYVKLKNTFFRNLSHEFKTPLNLIFSAIQIIKLKEKKDNKYINIIQQNSYRLLKLVNNLLDISKIESNSFNLNKKNVDIVKLISKIALSVESYIQNKNRIFSFETNLSEELIAIDANAIERVILNLISNAVKFTASNDKITIQLYKENEMTVIKVIDTGIGIKEKDQKRIFGEFNQVDNSLHKNHEGTGLGLTISSSLIRMHQGTIELKSNFGKGTEFKVKLPSNTLEETEYNATHQQELDMVKIELSDI